MSHINVSSVTVLGAGTMGARVAAHFANAGVPALLLSRANTTGPNRSATAAKAIEAAIKQKPAAFYGEDATRLVKAGNYEDHLQELAGSDWIVEAIVEQLDIKQRAARRASPPTRPAGTDRQHQHLRHPDRRIAEGRCRSDFRSHFLGTHFFNPPRYLQLLEMIPTPETDPAGGRRVSATSPTRVLGKGVVVAKDTPNFIGNRIGLYGVALIVARP